MNLSSAKREILFLARRTLNLSVRHQHSLLKYTPKNPFLKKSFEVILTLKNATGLRGRVKSSAFAPLYEVLIYSVIAASSFDRRFPSIKVCELQEIVIEVEILENGDTLLKVSE